MAIVAAGGMELVGIRRARERSLATGIVLGAGLGLSALFLYFDVTSHSTTGAAITVMFGLDVRHPRIHHPAYPWHQASARSW